MEGPGQDPGPGGSSREGNPQEAGGARRWMKSDTEPRAGGGEAAEPAPNDTLGLPLRLTAGHVLILRGSTESSKRPRDVGISIQNYLSALLEMTEISLPPCT